MQFVNPFNRDFYSKIPTNNETILYSKVQREVMNVTITLFVVFVRSRTCPFTAKLVCLLGEVKHGELEKIDMFDPVYHKLYSRNGVSYN